MIKNIIFDFDGVIVDSEILASKAFSQYFKNKGYSLKEEEFYNYTGMKTIQVIDILSKKYSIKNKKKFISDIFDIVSEFYAKDLKLVRGVKNYIKESKKKLFIGSNSNKSRIIEGLKIVDLIKYFSEETIYSFDMVNNPKPYPDIYLKIINDNLLNTEETIIIEDSSVGIKAAKSAGVRVFGLTAGTHWHSQRDKAELYNNGALNVFDNFENLDLAIESL